MIKGTDYKFKQVPKIINQKQVHILTSKVVSNKSDKKNNENLTEQTYTLWLMS